MSVGLRSKYMQVLSKLFQTAKQFLHIEEVEPEFISQLSEKCGTRIVINEIGVICKH